MQSHLLVRILPAALNPPSGMVCEVGCSFWGVFDAVFRDPGVVFLEYPGFAGQMHGLILRAYQSHFDPLLLGLDQPREQALMEAAYDDAAGFSAAFALNLLQRLNRELQGDADPAQFRYRARWQEQQQRIEMALVSTQDQTVHLAGETWVFKRDDAWITEHSVKYSSGTAADLANLAGWRIESSWEDPHQQMALHLLLPAD